MPVLAKNPVRTTLLTALAVCTTASLHAADWIVTAPHPDAVQLDAISIEAGHTGFDPLRGFARFVADDDSIERLRAQGIALQLDLAASAKLQSFASNGIPGYACYRTVEESYERMDELAAQHPDLASVVDIGPSWRRTQSASEGYQLRVLRLGNTATDATYPDKPSLFVISAIHAREYVTAETALRFGEWLVEQHGRDANATWLLDHYRFHLLVQANPDGRKIAETGVLWRKNVDDANGACNAQPPSSSYHTGIDLNRNFPFNWNNGGASASVCTQGYLGPAAASEPETQAIVAYVAGVQSSPGAAFSGGVFADRRSDDRIAAAPTDTTGVMLDLHSNGRLVLWPWGDTGTLAPNATALARFGHRIGWFNSYMPLAAFGIGASSGTTPDTAYGYLGVAAYTIELGGLDFFQDCDAFLADTLPKNLAALEYIARNLGAPYVLPAGPNAREVEVMPNLLVAGEQAQLRAIIDDNGFNAYNTSEPVHAISAANASIDALPWDAPTTIALDAGDGAFDTSAERVSTTLAADTLGTGRHLVHVQGRNSTGAEGAPAAAWVEVAAPAAVATIGGNVTDATTHAALGAHIDIVDSAGDAHAIDADAGGTYALHVHPGNAALTASRFGYLPQTIASITATAGQSSTRDVALIPACSAFSDDAESGPGMWSAQGWGIEQPVSGTHYWNDSPGTNYASSADLRLTSPNIDFSTYPSVVLDFDQRCYTEETYDVGTVELSTDAAHTAWTEVHRCSGMSQWQHARIELPAAAGQSNVQFRFRTLSDSSGDFDGWSIDNLRIGRDDDECRALSDTIFRNGFDA